MTILTDETRVARKRHRCEWCGESIEVGQRYRYYSGVFDGEFQSTHMHTECLLACDRELRNSYDDFFMPFEHARGKTEWEAEEDTHAE